MKTTTLTAIILLAQLSAMAQTTLPVTAKFSCTGRYESGNEIKKLSDVLTSLESDKTVKIENLEILFMLEKDGKVSIETDLDDMAVYSTGKTETTLELHALKKGGAGTEFSKEVVDLTCEISRK